HIDEANFGFFTGKKAFNEILSQRLIEAIRLESFAAARFLEKVGSIPAWESQLRISDKAKEIIAYSYVGVIGIQLSKLFAIGKEDLTDGKQRKYIEKCLQIAGRSLDLLSFALISSLWDAIAQQGFTLSVPQQERIAKRLDSNFEPSLPEQFDLFRSLTEIFFQSDKNLTIPLPELASFQHKLQSGGSLSNCVDQLNILNEKLDKAQYNLLDCFEAENQLTAFLEHFPFFACYRMASIKHIGYSRVRHADPGYLHRYAALGIDNKANVDAERINFTPSTAHTDAVLLYRGDAYDEYINLSPFIIDYNALTSEPGTRVCFFRSRDISDETLEYLFLEDSSIVRVEKKGILKPDSDYNELMLNAENRKILNLDNVVDQFREARRCIGGETLNFDDL
ncbi:MAG: hypothetical protein NWR72_16835, partial [Bacteroidia bacterium]|nr:hypothetical protein [Bacteroidia bacterium]